MNADTTADYSVTRIQFTQIISDAFDLSIYNYIVIFLINIPVVIINIVFIGSDYFALFEGVDRFWANPAVLRHALEDSDRLYWANTATAVWGFLASCGIARLFHDRLNKQPGSRMASVVAGMKRAPLALGVALIAGVAAVVVTMVFAVAIGLLGKLGFIAVLALFVVFAFVVVLYALAFAACVVDGAGPFAAFQIARDLTRGYRGSLLGLFFFASLFQAIFLTVLGLLAYAIGIAAMWAFPMVFVPFLTIVLAVVVMILVGMFATGWNNGLMIVTYNRLKALKGYAA
nr:hypothetical protein [Mesorhizobium loti]